MKRGLRILALACATGMALMAIPASAKAEPAYLALGDSVPFGFNPLALTTPPVFNPTIAANFVGYPEVLSKRLQVDVANASCPGETTMHFVSLTGLDDNCGLYRASLPLHVAYASSQLDYAVGFLLTHPNTGLVTVMVGADDLGAFARACGADEVCIQHDIATMSLPSLITIFGTIRSVYGGELVVVTYYARNNTPQEIGAVQQGDALITGVATQFGAQIADGFAAFQAAEGPSLDPCAANLLIRLPNGTCDSHPSALGQKVLAGAVKAVVRPED